MAAASCPGRFASTIARARSSARGFNAAWRLASSKASASSGADTDVDRARRARRELQTLYDERDAREKKKKGAK